MKKLLLTLLLLLSLGFAASAEEITLTKETFNMSGTSYVTYTANDATSGLSFAIRGSVQSGNMTFNKTTNNCFFMVTGNTKNVTIESVTITFGNSGTKQNVVVYKSDAPYAQGSNDAGSVTNVTNTTLVETLTVDEAAHIVEIGAPYFGLSYTGSNMAQMSSIAIKYAQDNVGTEKIDLVQDNLVVKAGDVVLEDEEEVELDANTVVTFAYSTDVENADIAYSYSVNGEDAIEGKSYTFTGEDDVIFTATATSNNEVSKTVYLLKKYPTECPTPSFSVADGAEVYAGQIISVKAEGAESILLEANEVPQDGTSYVVAGEPGDVITLHALASVTGKNGAITAEYSITVTVVEATEAMYDFNKSDAYGLSPKSGDTNADYETEVLTITTDPIVTVTVSGTYRLVTVSGEYALRLHATKNSKGVGRLTVTVPSDYYITGITFGTGSTNTNTPNNAEVTEGTTVAANKWDMGGLKLSEVYIQRSSNNPTIKTMTVNYAKLPETELVGFTHEESFGKTQARMNYMLHLNNHKDTNVYTVVLTVNGVEFPCTEHTDASIVEETANAPMRVLNPNDVESETTLKGTILATGLEGDSEYPASVSVKLGDKELHSEAIDNFKTGTTGIEDVTVENEAAAEYFNLQGVRVAEPQAGQIYIVRRGAKATKELVK